MKKVQSLSTKKPTTEEQIVALTERIASLEKRFEEFSQSIHNTIALYREEVVKLQKNIEQQTLKDNLLRQNALKCFKSE